MHAVHFTFTVYKRRKRKRKKWFFSADLIGYSSPTHQSGRVFFPALCAFRPIWGKVVLLDLKWGLGVLRQKVLFAGVKAGGTCW